MEAHPTGQTTRRMGDKALPLRPPGRGEGPADPRDSGVAPASGGQRVGPYRVIEELGRGGSGIVFLAKHPQGREPVALKLLLTPWDKEEVTRFQREVGIAARLKNPGIVPILDWGQDAARPYYAMEYCPGPTLQQHLRLHGTWSPVEAAHLVEQLGEIAAYAHQFGIIHRDLKPANVILGQDKRPRITDFGLARDLTQSRLTHTGDVMGTPFYMAPEQVRGDRDLDHRVDVYALGVILYRAISGRYPFDAESYAELAPQVVRSSPTPLRSVCSSAPVEIEAICNKALARERDERYATAADLAQALEEFCRSQPGSPSKWAAGVQQPQPQSAIPETAPPPPSDRITQVVAGLGIGVSLILAGILFGQQESPAAPLAGPSVARPDGPGGDPGREVRLAVLETGLAELDWLAEQDVNVKVRLHRLEQLEGVTAEARPGKELRDRLGGWRTRLEREQRVTARADELRAAVQALRERAGPALDEAQTLLAELKEWERAGGTGEGRDPSEDGESLAEEIAGLEADLEILQLVDSLGRDEEQDGVVGATVELLVKSEPTQLRIMAGSYRVTWAISALDEELQRRPHSASLLLLRGLMLRRAARYDESVAQYQALIGREAEVEGLLQILMEQRVIAPYELYEVLEVLGLNGPPQLEPPELSEPSETQPPLRDPADGRN